MTHRNALGIAVELQHDKVVLAIHTKGASVLFDKVLRVAGSFESVRQSDGGMTTLDLHYSRLVLAAYREDAFEDLPRVLFDLLVAEAHAAVLLVEFENDNFNLIAYVAEF